MLIFFSAYYWLKYRLIQTGFIALFLLDGYPLDHAKLAAYHETHAVWAQDLRHAQKGDSDANST